MCHSVDTHQVHRHVIFPLEVAPANAAAERLLASVQADVLRYVG
jgi:hypothetical protein